MEQFEVFWSLNRAACRPETVAMCKGVNVNLSIIYRSNLIEKCKTIVSSVFMSSIRTLFSEKAYVSDELNWTKPGRQSEQDEIIK